MNDLDKILQGKLHTSATIIPAALRQHVTPNGFRSDSGLRKYLFVCGEPRKYSLTYDYLYTSMAFFMAAGQEVALRDLYDLNFDPVLREKDFYYVKDGIGEAPKELIAEQDWIRQADTIIFVYPNWHDTPNAIVKGYMEKVFAKEFAYTDSPRGPIGLLTEKRCYTIMNCGYLGGGAGYVGDGLGQNDALWDQYMSAFKVFDDDTAAFWGMTNAGRFVSDQHPHNFEDDYEEKLQLLRNRLRGHLKRDLL